jgi:hypothetical protein
MTPTIVATAGEVPPMTTVGRLERSPTPNWVRKSSLTTSAGERFCRSASLNHRPWTGWMRCSSA